MLLAHVSLDLGVEAVGRPRLRAGRMADRVRLWRHQPSLQYGVAAFRITFEIVLHVSTLSRPEMKIRRARRHTQELVAVWVNFIARRPITVRIWSGERARKHETFCRERVPEDVPLLIGDAVHNIRSASDLLANDLLRIAGSNKSDARFPFGESENDYTEMEKRGRLNGLPDDLRTMIKALKPWEGTLRAIHKLDIVDKHQMVVPTLIFAKPGEYGFGVGVSAHGGGAIMSIRVAGDPEPEWTEINATAAENDINASLKLVFRFPNVGEAVNPEIEVPVALEQYVYLVDGIIQTFKAYCLRS